MPVVSKKWTLNINLPKNWKQKLCFVLGMVLFFFCLWQIDVICGWRIFSTTPLAAPVNMPYEVGRIGSFAFVTTTGAGYDLMQAGIVLGLVISVLSLWFWDE
jgi:hypothetical protein